MKPFYHIFVKGSGTFQIATSKKVAKQDRAILQREGHKAVYIRQKKGTSRLSDF